MQAQNRVKTFKFIGIVAAILIFVTAGIIANRADYVAKNWWQLYAFSGAIYAGMKILHLCGWPKSTLWSPYLFSFSMPLFLILVIYDDTISYLIKNLRYIFFYISFIFWAIIAALFIPQTYISLMNIYEVMRKRMIMEFHKKVVLFTVIHAFSMLIWSMAALDI